LVVTSNQGGNKLYLNKGNKFEDISSKAGLRPKVIGLQMLMEMVLDMCLCGGRNQQI
jgi:hypothetical protein